MMEIEFDPEKSRRNEIERGFGFERAAAFDLGTAVKRIDDRRNYGEIRWRALGDIEGRIYALAFTETERGIRVISFRKANGREVAIYERNKNSRS